MRLCRHGIHGRNRVPAQQLRAALDRRWFGYPLPITYFRRTANIAQIRRAQREIDVKRRMLREKEAMLINFRNQEALNSNGYSHWTHRLRMLRRGFVALDIAQEVVNKSIEAYQKYESHRRKRIQAHRIAVKNENGGDQYGNLCEVAARKSRRSRVLAACRPRTNRVGLNT